MQIADAAPGLEHQADLYTGVVRRCRAADAVPGLEHQADVLSLRSYDLAITRIMHKNTLEHTDGQHPTIVPVVVYLFHHQQV